MAMSDNRPLPVAQPWLSEITDMKECLSELEKFQITDESCSQYTAANLKRMLDTDDSQSVLCAIADTLNAGNRLVMGPCCYRSFDGRESLHATSSATTPFSPTLHNESISEGEKDCTFTPILLYETPEVANIEAPRSRQMLCPQETYANDIVFHCLRGGCTPDPCTPLGVQEHSHDRCSASGVMKPAPFIRRSIASSSPASQSITSLIDDNSVQELSGEMIHSDGFTVICDYEIIDELGRGSFGTVNLAIDVNNETADPVAIKTLQRKPAKNEGRMRREYDDSDGSISSPSISTTVDRRRFDIIECEITLMKRLRHKNLVRLHAVIEDKRNHEVHLVMQYIDNGPIAKLSRDATCTPLPVEDALHYMVQVSAGIDYLHKHNILHRDVKPENILIDRHRNAYVADFGVSSLAEDVCNAASNQAAGTFPFFSPELCAEKDALKRFGKECDVWAFGVTLFVIIYGKLPFSGWNRISLIRSIINEPPAFPTDRPEVPELLVSLLKRLLEKQPEKRMTLRQFRSAVSDGTMPKPHSPVQVQSPQDSEFKHWSDSESDDDSSDYCDEAEEAFSTIMGASIEKHTGIVSGIVSFRKRAGAGPRSSILPLSNGQHQRKDCRPLSCNTGKKRIASLVDDSPLTRSASSATHHHRSVVVKKAGKGFVHNVRNLRNQHPSTILQ